MLKILKILIDYILLRDLKLIKLTDYTTLLRKITYFKDTSDKLAVELKDGDLHTIGKIDYQKGNTLHFTCLKTGEKHTRKADETYTICSSTEEINYHEDNVNVFRPIPKIKKYMMNWYMIWSTRFQLDMFVICTAMIQLINRYVVPFAEANNYPAFNIGMFTTVLVFMVVRILSATKEHLLAKVYKIK